MIGQSVIVRDPDILGGLPVFRGSRVPVQTLIDYLEHGQSIDDFLDDFPTIERNQVLDVFDQMSAVLLEQPA
ncbi:MAG: DUF433 domain-containing protein [Anaerolineae bacterium]|nr:DUF433 domain-containing protein [Anaerolineae bacterium]MCB0255327.1 DUF433 domain-containing protein [Anaerolineae bacterium]